MHGRTRRRLRPWLLAAAALALASPARADAIDGDWCRPDGRRMTIRGSDIVTPGGRQARGDYTRHSFRYLVPAGEPGAGDSIEILLRNEYLAVARQGGSGDWQEWKRCSATVS